MGNHHMALKIFPTDANGETAKKNKSTFQDDVVGRFRSGYVAGRKPVALQEWRVTTGDPTVADRIVELLGSPEGVKEWDATGEDNLEVFTEAPSVNIIIENEKALRQAMVLYGRDGIVHISDGETITVPEEKKGQPDPQAGLTFQERKAAHRAKELTAAQPRVELWFRLADEPDLGLFKFQSSSWSLVSDLDYNGTEDELAELAAAGTGVRATLALEEVSFVAKNGPMKGKTVAYTKPVVTLKGAVS
jgi:hypothetical protein